MNRDKRGREKGEGETGEKGVLGGKGEERQVRCEGGTVVAKTGYLPATQGLISLGVLILEARCWVPSLGPSNTSTLTGFSA